MKVVNFPCEVFDVMYYLDDKGNIRPFEVNEILYRVEAENHGVFVRERFFGIIGAINRQFDFSEIGEKVFKTRKDAERKLEKGE